MLLDRLLGLPSPAVHVDSLKHFSTHLVDHQVGPESTEELLTIATSLNLYYGTEHEFFATHYAFYALAALDKSDACSALIQHLNRLDDINHDWMAFYIQAFEIMGRKAIPYLMNASKTINIAILYVITESLAKLSKTFPEYRQSILKCFDELLTRVDLCALPLDAIFSGETCILFGWMEMHAIERIKVIRRLNAQHKFDTQYVGHMADIEAQIYQYDLTDLRKLS